MKLRASLLAALASVAFVGAAAAQPVLVDFTPGFGFIDPGPHTYQGVTFTNLGGGSGGTGFQANNNWGSFFDNVGGSSQGNALNDFFGNTVFQFDLPSPSDNVSILLSTTPITQFRVEAFDSGLNSLGFVTATMPNASEAVQAILPFSGVARIVVSEPNGENGNFTLFDDLRFTPAAVPEPTTIALCGLGLCGAAIGGWKRRKQKRGQAKAGRLFARQN